MRTLFSHFKTQVLTLSPPQLAWSQIARFMRPTWGLTGANRTQVGPMLASWTLLSGMAWIDMGLKRIGILLVTPCLLPRIQELYPHAASPCHVWPKAKHGIAMLSVDKFPYPRKQTRGNEFIPCSNNICDILKHFRSFKIPAITLIWSKSPYKHIVTRSYRSGKESGRQSELPLRHHQWRSLVFISHTDNVKPEIRLYISRLLTNQKRESALSMG